MLKPKYLNSKSSYNQF